MQNQNTTNRIGSLPLLSTEDNVIPTNCNGVKSQSDTPDQSPALSTPLAKQAPNLTGEIYEN